MADITITVGNVLPSTAATRATGIAGATIAQGQVVYRDSADSNKLKLADANAAGDAHVVAGIAENAGAAGQVISYITRDPQLAIGGTVAAGTTVILSANPGFMCPDTDGVTGWFKTILGVGIGSNKINFNPVSTTVAIP